MDGSRDNGYGYGFGWKGRNVRNATFTGNELTNLYKGVSLRLGGGMVISGNSLHDYRSDAIYIAEAEDITILDNRMTDPRPFLLPRGQADHPDFIQIAEINGGLIENNYMDIGVTAEFSQGIFGGPNRNLVIRNNVIATRATNGLSFGSLTNSEIANNLVVDAVLPPHMERVSPGRQRQQPRLHVRPSYSDVRVTGNLASMYNRGFDQASRSGQVAAAGNSLVQSLHPRGPNYYEYHADAGARASSGAGLRIGNVWLATVPASTGFDAARFTYLDEGPARAPGRCRRT
jgi:nitrous oxidase accessory protein NosD